MNPNDAYVVKNCGIVRGNRGKSGHGLALTADFTDVNSKKEKLASDAYILAIDCQTADTYGVT